MFRKLRRKIVRLGIVSGSGAAATYFLDPERGVERREQAKAKASAMLKRGGPAGADWQSKPANGFYAPTSETATAPLADLTGTTPVDLLVVETTTVTVP